MSGHRPRESVPLAVTNSVSWFEGNKGMSGSPAARCVKEKLKNVWSPFDRIFELVDRLDAG
jgi:hypothetical protein